MLRSKKKGTKMQFVEDACVCSGSKKKRQDATVNSDETMKDERYIIYR